MQLKKFVLQSFSYTGAHWAGVLITFLVTAYITRIIGPEERGIYAWALGILTLTIQGGLFGLDTIFRVKAVRAHNPAPLYVNGVIIAGVIGMVFFLGTALVSPLVVSDPIARIALIAAMLSLPAALALIMIVTIFQSRCHIRSLIYVTLGQKIIQAILFFVLALTPWLNAQNLLVVGVLAAVLSLAQATFYAYKHSGAFWRASIAPLTYLKDWNLGACSYVADLTMGCFTRIPLLLSFAYLGAATTGLFSIAVMLVDLMLIIPGTLAVMIAPHSVRSSLSPTQIKRQLWKLNVTIFAILLLVAGLSWVCSPWAIMLVYGQEFSGAVAIFQYMLVYFIAMGVFRLVYAILVNHCKPVWLLIPPLTGVLVWGFAFMVLGVDNLDVILQATTVGAIAMAITALTLFTWYPMSGIAHERIAEHPVSEDLKIE